MTTESNKALLRRMFQAVNDGNFDELEDHPGFWETRTVVPPMHNIFADWQTPLMQQIAEDGKVFSYGVTEMTHIGPFMGVAPANKRVALQGLFLDQVVEDRVVEHNGTTSWPEILQQLGHPAFAHWLRHEQRLLTHQTSEKNQNSTTLASNKQLVAGLLEALSQGDDSVTAQHDGLGQPHEEFAAIRAAFPDLHYTTVMQVAEGELVGTRATLQGTNTGSLFGFAPTGKTLTWDYFCFVRVVGEQVVEAHGTADWSAAMFHLGLVSM